MNNPIQQQGNALSPQEAFSRALELHKQDELEAAQHIYEALLIALPEDANLNVNLGNLYQDLGYFEKAEEKYRKVLQLEPETPRARNNLGSVLLRQGNFAQGFEYFEARWELPAKSAQKRPFPQPWWQGEDLTDKTILLWGDQGLGDEIMFCRMLSDISKQAKHCIVEINCRRVPMLQTSFPHIQFIPRTEPVDPLTQRNDIDVQLPLTSLGKFFRKKLDDFDDGSAYIQPNPEKIAACRQKYDQLGDGIKVGISWHTTNPEETARRSIPLAKWRPLFDNPNMHFINLQYGDHDNEIAATGFVLYQDKDIDPMAFMDDYAAQIAALDLVISIDNSTVHIAGAVGTDVWVLLPHVAEWRWLVDRSDSPWYTSATLFRQSIRGDWSDVLQTVSEQLNNF